MKNYTKPIVIESDELAEGVYAASGCYTYFGTNGGNPSGDDQTIEYNITFHHDPAGHNCYHTFTFEFSEPISAVSCITNCSNASFSGCTVTVTGQQAQANASEEGEYCDIGIKVTYSGTVGKLLHASSSPLL